MAYLNWLRFLFDKTSKGTVKTADGRSNFYRTNLFEPFYIRVSPAFVFFKPEIATISPAEV
jgi:hypothetical protein